MQHQLAGGIALALSLIIGLIALRGIPAQAQEDFSGIYSGTTSQHQRISLLIDGRTINSITLRAKVQGGPPDWCTGDVYFVANNPPRGLLYLESSDFDLFWEQEGLQLSMQGTLTSSGASGNFTLNVVGENRLCRGSAEETWRTSRNRAAPPPTAVPVPTRPPFPTLPPFPTRPPQPPTSVPPGGKEPPATVPPVPPAATATPTTPAGNGQPPAPTSTPDSEGRIILDPPPGSNAGPGTLVDGRISPEWWPCEFDQVKGQRTTRLYHRPGEPDYDRVYEDIDCFDTLEEAEDAGYTPAQPG